MANIKLKDGTGQKRTYNGVTKIQVPNASGSESTEFVIPVLDTLSVTQNGTYTPPSGTDGYDEIVVVIPTYDGTVV